MNRNHSAKKDLYYSSPDRRDHANTIFSTLESSQPRFTYCA